MRCVDVLVQRLDPDLPLPSYAHPGDAGADLCTAVDLVLARANARWCRRASRWPFPTATRPSCTPARGSRTRSASAS